MLPIQQRIRSASHMEQYKWELLLKAIENFSDDPSTSRLSHLEQLILDYRMYERHVARLQVLYTLGDHQ
jgi:hypothetical protein